MNNKNANINKLVKIISIQSYMLRENCKNNNYIANELYNVCCLSEKIHQTANKIKNLL